MFQQQIDCTVQRGRRQISVAAPMNCMEFVAPHNKTMQSSKMFRLNLKAFLREQVHD